MTPSLVEQGYRGHGVVSAQGFQIAVASPNVTAEQTRATFIPVFEAAHSLPDLSVQNSTFVLQDWLDFCQLLSFSPSDVGIPTEPGLGYW